MLLGEIEDDVPVHLSAKKGAKARFGFRLRPGAGATEQQIVLQAAQGQPPSDS